MNDAVSASAIVLAGESAGVALIRHPDNFGTTKNPGQREPFSAVSWKNGEVPMPAGVARVSGAMDQALAVP